MVILSLNVTVIELLALLLGMLILGAAIYLFQSSRRSLQDLFRQPDALPLSYGLDQLAPNEKPFVQAPLSSPGVQHEQEAPVFAKAVKQEEPAPRVESVASLRNIIAEQQQLLTALLDRAEESEQQRLAEQNKVLEDRITSLELQLDAKEQERGMLQQQIVAAHKMTERIEDVYREFNALQQRLQDMEAQAARTRKLEMEVVDQQESFDQLKRDLMRKQTKLEETFAENQRLQQQLNEVEDKLAEANMQRQQLQKRVQFLQDVNNDLQSMSESNKKLQTELRRINELENMLHMIAEERDQLLRRQGDR